MAEFQKFMLDVITRIYSNWSALKIVVEHQMGMGSVQEARDFCEWTEELLRINDQLDGGDVAMELDKYFNERFETILEDESSDQIAMQIVEFYRLCLARDEKTAVEKFGQLPPLQSWISDTAPLRKPRVPVQDSSSSDEDETIDEDMEVESTEAPSDEWIEVKGRKKR